MGEKIDIFGVLNDLSFGKRDIFAKTFDEAERNKILGAYNPYIANKFFSFHISSILDAAILNQCADLDKDLQYAYYLHSTKSERRFSKWFKTKIAEDIELIVDVYDVSYSKAVEFRKILTDEQLVTLREAQEPGGAKDGKLRKRKSS